MNKKGLKLIIMFETILIIIIAMICGYMVGKAYGKIYRLEADYKALQENKLKICVEQNLLVLQPKK